MKKSAMLLLVNLTLIGTVWAAGNEYTDRIRVLSDHILITAQQLKVHRMVLFSIRSR